MRVGLVLAAVAVPAYATLATVFYLSERSPSAATDRLGTAATVLGPTPLRMEREVDELLQSGLDALGDSALPPAVRLDAYRDRLERAERLLQRSLVAQPGRAETLYKLAAVRWELDPPLDDVAASTHLEMIERAATLAPAVPGLQKDIGELLVKMGRWERAMAYFVRTLELDPGRSREVVEVLRQHLIPAREMLDRLPRTPDTLVALQWAFFDEGLEVEYANEVEPLLDRATSHLLGAYSRSFLRRRAHAELIGRLTDRGAYDDPELEAERLLQQSSARFELGEVEAALIDARAARELQPEVARYGRHLARTHLRAQRHEQAIEEARRVLAVLGRQRASRAARASLYLLIGEAEEARGRAGSAHKAYRTAHELAPDDPVAARAMERVRTSVGAPRGLSR
ncbi:MAG: hypothetical protein GY716_10795 [bacterium]|nr:hypothetical protein [bacterium]